MVESVAGLGGQPRGRPTMTEAPVASNVVTAAARQDPVPMGKVPHSRCVTPSPKRNRGNGSRQAANEFVPDSVEDGVTPADDNGIVRLRGVQGGEV